jgi:cold-inducible RNA-binding protein
LIALVDRAAVP